MDNQKADLSALRIDRSSEQPSPPRGSRKLVRTSVIVVSIALLLLAGNWIVPRVFDSPVEVQIATATMSSSSQANAVLTASGYVVAQRKAAVASKGTGRLDYLGVVEGDRVKKGQVIGRLEDADMKAALDQASANLKLNEADLKDAERWVARQKTLLDKGVSTQSDYDAAEARYERTVASIAVAKAEVAGADVALENMLIRAPFDGTVLSKNADVGEMVAPMAASISSRSAVVTVADMSSLQVEADVSESNIERIALGQPCEITLDAYPDVRYQASVAKIVPTADRAKATVLVKVAFKSYDARVLPEMSCKVLFLTRVTEGASTPPRSILTVPLNAVVTRNGKKVVFLVRNEQATETPVVTGKDAGALVEITRGLSAGDRVIAGVTDKIVDGLRVKSK
jgi:HlyD family secretion protein